MVSKILKTVPLADLEKWTSLSYDTLQSYRLGRRTPPPDVIRKIARALRSHGTTMVRHAQELEAELERNP